MDPGVGVGGGGGGGGGGQAGTNIFSPSLPLKVVNSH